MESVSALPSPARSLANWSGWAAVLGASLAMAATLPGRTHGLGLIETRVTADFPPLTPEGFARLNLLATLLGSLFCFPGGWLIDRFGAGRVGVGVLLALGATVIGMSYARDQLSLAVALTLTRGIGQSLLSVVSLAIIGKAFPERSGAAMGTYAVVMTTIMAIGTGIVGERVTAVGWRGAWHELGLAVLAGVPLLALLSWPGSAELPVEQSKTEPAAPKHASATWQQALRTPCFWVFALAIAFFGLASSGISLFQQRLLEARGQPEHIFHIVLVTMLVTGLFANLGGGWAALHTSLSGILAAGMVVLAGAFAWLAFLSTPGEAVLFGILYGIAGGLIMVAFFAVWGQAFGEAELARIQGIAQMLTVVGSAAGPEIVAQTNTAFGSYQPVLLGFAAVSLLLALVAAFTPVPAAVAGDWN